MKKYVLIFIFFIIFLSFSFLYDFLEITSLGIPFLSIKTNFMLILLMLLIIIYFMYLLKYNKQLLKYKSRDEIFKFIIQDSQTIYFIYDELKDKIVYTTNNIKQILCVESIINESEALKLVNDVFEHPIIKEEYRVWNKQDVFESQMVNYCYLDDKKINRIRVKIYPFVDKKNKCQLIAITNANEEYEKQHLLIGQAKSIKTREKQLQQITKASYDIEINLDMISGEYKLNNLKDNISYLGSSKSGKYKTAFKEIITEYVYLEDQEEVLRELSFDKFNRLIKDGDDKPYFVRYRLANYDNVIWLESIVFILMANGEGKVIILTKNVTEDTEYMRRQNQLLETALEEAEKANHAKTEFLTIVSHQIRTQMDAVIGLSESALADNLPIKAREDVADINSASTHLLEIIDDLLDISKIEAGIIDVNEKEYDATSLFKNLIGLTREKIKDKNIKFNTKIDPKLPKRLFGDSGKVKQVILNILYNAVEYTPEGQIDFNVDFKKRNQNVDIIIIIKDTGMGMSEEYLKEMFAETNGLDYTKNMGITIVKKLLNLIKGKIEVESKLNEGSKFTVTISQRIIDEQGIGKIDEYASSKKVRDYFKADGKKILVVDDNLISLKVATRFLEQYGILLETADSGQECLNLIKTGEEFDLILMDEMMPELSGTETFHKLKEDLKFQTPVVVLTADAISGVREKYLKEGFDDYLSKPIDEKELKRVLKKFLK